MSRPFKAIVVGLATLLVVALVLSLPAIREMARARVVTALSHATGTRVAADALDYSLLSLSATARGIRVAAGTQAAAPFFEADRVTVNLGWRSFGGAWQIDAVEIDRPSLRLAELQRFLADRPAVDPTSTTGSRLERVSIGRLVVTGLQLTPAVDAPVTFDLRGRGLSLAMSRDGSGALSGRAHLDGTSTLRLGEVTTPITRLDGSLTLAGSRLAWRDVEIGGADLAATASGVIDRIDAGPRVAATVSATASVLFLKRIEPRLPLAGGALRARIEAKGALDAPAARVEVAGDALQLTDGSPAALTVSAVVADGRLRVDSAEARACGGTASLTADLALGPDRAADTGAVSWRRINVEHALRVAGVGGTRLAAAADGRATFTGPLDLPSALRAEVTAALVPLEATRGVPARARLNATLAGGTWTAVVRDARVGEATLGARARGRVGQGWAEATLSGEADLAAPGVTAVAELLTALGAGTGALGQPLSSGAARTHAVLGGTLGAPTVQAGVEVEQLRVAGAGGYDLSGAVRFDSRGVTANQVVAVQGRNRVEGGVSVSHSGRLEGSFRGEAGDLAALADAMPAAYRPSAGTLEASGTISGTTARPRVNATLTAARVLAAGQQIDAAQASVVIDGPIARVDRIEVNSGAGRMTGRGRYDSGAGRFAIDELRARSYPVRPLPGPPANPPDSFALALTATADIDASLHGRVPEVRGTASIRLRDARWHEEPLGDVAAELSASPGHVDFDIRNDQLGAHATGRVGQEAGWPIDAAIRFAATDVGHLARLVAIPQLSALEPSGRAEAVLRVAGTLADRSQLAYDVSIPSAAIVAGGLPITVDRPVTASVRGTVLLEADAELHTGGSRARLVREGPGAPVTLQAEGELSDLAPLMPVVEGKRLRASGPLRVRLSVPDPDRLGEAGGEVTCVGCRVVVAGLPPVDDIAVDARLDAGRLTLARATARWEKAIATARGSVPVAFAADWMPVAMRDALPPAAADAEASLTITGASASLARALMPPGSLRRIEGAVDLSLSARAGAPTLAAVRAEATVTRAEVQLGDVRLAQDAPARLELVNQRLTLSEWRLSGGGTDLTVKGGAEFDGREPVYETGIEGRVDLRALNPFIPGRIAGLADLRIAARGQPDALVWNGRIDLTDGALVQRAQRLALVDLEAGLALSGDRVTVERLTGRLNGGALEVTGALELHGGGLEGRLTGTIRGAGVELPPGTRHDLDADLELRLGPDAELGGTVTVLPGTVKESIVSLAALVEQFKPDPVADARRPGRAESRSLPLNLVLRTADDLVFDSNDLRVAAYGDLTIAGTTDRPLLLGQVRARDDSEVFLLGRTWTLDDSAIDFVKGAAGTEVRLAITGGARIGSYQVQMRVTGPTERIAMSLNSDPPLGRSDLTELVMTGGVSSGDSTRKGSQQIATAVSAEVLGTVGRVVGLDTVRIEQNSDDLSTTDIEPVSRLTIGERLGDHFEVIYSQNLGNTDDVAWILLYRPGWRGLEARFTYRTNAAEAYELRQELFFGGPGRRAAPRAPRRPRPTVADIVITGVDASEAAALRGLMKLKPGRRFDAGDWQGDEERVARYYRERDRLLSRVRTSRVSDGTGVTLKYDITPGPLARIEVTGYEADPETIDAMRAVWARVVLEEFLDEELPRPLRFQLARDGYFQPEISARFRPLPAGDGRLATVQVTPGPRAGKRAIVLDGNTAVSTAELRKTIDARCARLRCWVEPAVLRAPLQALYRTRGYLDAQVAARRPALDGTTATLRVDITEGPRYLVGRVSATGTETYGERAALDAFGLAPDTPYEPPALAKAIDDLRTAYYRVGFRDAEVTAATSVETSEARVAIEVRVREGARSVLQDVVVGGRHGASQRLVESAMQLPAGGVLDSVALDNAQQRLYETGIFRSVDIGIEPVAGGVASPPDQPVRAVVSLEERPRYRLRYGVQFGPTTIEDVAVREVDAQFGVTADLQRRNLFGLGINAGAGGFWSLDQYRMRVTANATTFFGRFVDTTLTAETVDQDRDTGTAGVRLLDRSNRAVLEQRWRRGRDRRIEFAYGFDVDGREVVYQFEDGSGDLLRLDARVAAFTTTFTYDARDNIFNPRAGWFHSSRIEAGPGGWLSDVAFSRYQAQQYAYVPLGPVVFASGLRFGSLDVDDELQTASLALRFKAGGSTTVRGYEQDSLSPLTLCVKDGRAQLGGTFIAGAECLPLGGKVLLVINEEVRVPLYRWFGAAAFVDLGNTFEGLDTFAWGDLALGTGLGLRINTPVFVVRLDAGFPVPRETGGPRVRWYFSIGQAF